jgi:hypothetical protein
MTRPITIWSDPIVIFELLFAVLLIFIWVEAGARRRVFAHRLNAGTKGLSPEVVSSALPRGGVSTIAFKKVYLFGDWSWWVVAGNVPNWSGFYTPSNWRRQWWPHGAGRNPKDLEKREGCRLVSALSKTHAGTGAQSPRNQDLSGKHFGVRRSGGAVDNRHWFSRRRAR